MLIALDFTAVFDTLDWQHIVNNLRSKNVDEVTVNAMKELLVNRSVIFDDSCRRTERTVETGCPQGSCSSPLVWRIGANDLLDKLTEAGVEVVAFADDTAIVIAEKNKQRFKQMIRRAFQALSEWSALNKSKMACLWVGKRSYDEEI